uniref:Uncharacterized protein n=1 Tax=Romanomermis culicivorax TaxID=13658 RepID=A0A915ISS0_ROMCU
MEQTASQCPLKIMVIRRKFQCEVYQLTLLQQQLNCLPLFTPLERKVQLQYLQYSHQPIVTHRHDDSAGNVSKPMLLVNRVASSTIHSQNKDYTNPVYPNGCDIVFPNAFMDEKHNASKNSIDSHHYSTSTSQSEFNSRYERLSRLEYTCQKLERLKSLFFPAIFYP